MRYRLQRHDGTDCSATMVPITVLRMVPIQRYRQSIDANDIATTGFYSVYCWEQDIASKHYPMQLGHLIVFQDGQGGSISQIAISSEGYAYTRMKWGDHPWSDWR